MSGTPTSEPAAPEARLDSWKEIAAYLGRNERTVRRWEEREGLPVHRLVHEKRGSVFAYRSELDQWWNARKVTVEPPAMGKNSETLNSTPKSARYAGSRIWVLVAAVLLVAVGGALAIRKFRPHSGVENKIRSIVVIPLRNLSPDPGQEYFSDGATDALISSLAQIQDLRVISFTSAMRYKGTTKPLPEIGRELAVDGVVEGSIQQEGSRVRISAQLIEASSDRHLWAQVYDRERSDLLKAQAEVARAIAEEIRGRLTPEEAKRFKPRTVAAAAQEEYLLGHDHVWKMNERDQLEALRHFEQAVRLQPDYADAHAQIGGVYLNRAIFTRGIPFHDGEQPAFEALQRALELDPDLAIGHDLLADWLLQYKHDWGGAEAQYERAIELNPNSLDARADHACLLAALGRFQDVFAELDRAVALDPQNSFVEYIYGTFAGLARKYDVAERHFQRALELDPQNFQAQIGRLRLLTFQGRFERALALLEQQVKAHGGDLSSNAFAGVLFAKLGRREEALHVLAEVTAKNAKTDQGMLASLYFAIGDLTNGFKTLEHLYDVSSPIFAAYDPTWDPVRSDPRFKAQLKRLQLPE